MTTDPHPYFIEHAIGAPVAHIESRDATEEATR